MQVSNELNFELAAPLQGDGTLRFTIADNDLTPSTVTLSGSGSTFTGGLDFDGVNAVGLTPGSLGTGTITISNAQLTFSYPLSSPQAILQLRGADFSIVLDEDIAVANLIGLNENGEVAFSLLDLPGGNSGPFTAEELGDLFQLPDAISGDGTLTLLRDAGDLDNDGLSDAWERENFGDTSAAPDQDPDGDGLDNLAEQGASTNPQLADTDEDGLTDGEEVTLHRTNPTSKDSDGDSLEDADEIARNLNPINADTDADGLEDGFEIQTSLTAADNPDTDGDGFSDKAELDNAADPLDAASQPNQFVVRTIASDGGTVNSLASARALRDRINPGIETLGLHSTLNFSDNEAIPGLIDGDVLFDGEVTDHFIVHAVGKFVLPSAGSWGIGFHSEDGGQLIVNGTEIIEFDGTRGRNSTMRTLDLAAGEHTLEVLMFERIGGAALEVYRSNEPGEWGDVGNGTLPADFDPVLIRFARGESPSPSGSMAIRSISSTSDGLTLTFDSDQPVDIAYSQDLQDWEVIAEGVESPYVDAEADRQGRDQGYYRLMEVPEP